MLVSVDSGGHIYLWEYNTTFLKPSLSFKPSKKSRIVLDIPQYAPQNDIVQKFPASGRDGRPPPKLIPTKLTREERLSIEEYIAKNPLDNVFAESIATRRDTEGLLVINTN